MLIDAGNIGQEKPILSYLSAAGVEKLDFLVATHPHADHIGSMAAVIKAMSSVEVIIMPDVIHTTSTFEKLLDAIEEKDIVVVIPQSGEVFEMEDVEIKILAPKMIIIPA